ncbi:hypothetical protein QNA19_10640 [Rhodococcus fascians]|uniref:hypothetical protein n=1 Tax=Rhodococcoides fascians TaxID=1828 RepID=UPI0024BA3A84|nr:hypothetical protein [Rhodococcus fascians]MDJ0426376.1 hypothetical protein [Rhodococcus fascians]
METVLTFLLIRFAVVAAVVTIVAVILFAIAVRLKRRGRWSETKRRIGPVAVRTADLYARRVGRQSPTARTANAAARLIDHDGDHSS